MFGRSTSNVDGNTPYFYGTDWTTNLNNANDPDPVELTTFTDRSHGGTSAAAYNPNSGLYDWMFGNGNKVYAGPLPTLGGGTPDSAPTSISLSANSIAENSTGKVGDLSEDGVPTGTFTITGGADQADFSIQNTDELHLDNAKDFETDDVTLDVTVTATNSEGNTSQAFVVNITDVAEGAANSAPTDIALSSSSIQENNSVNDVVGVLSSTDSDGGDTHTYNLVAGAGDTDNASFNISGTNLRASTVFDFETKTSYSVRVQTNDGTDTFAKALTITITDESEGVAHPDPVAIGDIWSDATFNSGDYNNASGSGIAFQTNKLRMTGGTANFAHYIEATNIPDYTRHSLEAWVQRVRFRTPTSFSNTAYGFGVGVTSLSSPDNLFNIARFSFNNTGQWFAKPTLYDNSTFTRQIVPGTAYGALATNTVYELEMERSADEFIFRLYASNGTTLLDDWTVSPSNKYANTSWLYHNNGRFALWNFGGSFDILGWDISVPARDYAYKNPKVLFVGNSNTTGFKAGLSNRFVDQLIALGGLDATQVATFAGVGNRIADIYNSRDALLAMNPEYLILSIGVNDLRANNGSTQADWTQLADWIRTNMPNTTLIPTTILAANSENVTSLSNHIGSYATTHSLTLIDLFDATKQAGNTNIQGSYNVGDGLHYSTAGHTAIRDRIVSDTNGVIDWQ